MGIAEGLECLCCRRLYPAAITPADTCVDDTNTSKIRCVTFVWDDSPRDVHETRLVAAFGHLVATFLEQVPALALRERLQPFARQCLGEKYDGLASMMLDFRQVSVIDASGNRARRTKRVFG